MHKQEKLPTQTQEGKEIIQLIVFLAGNEEFGVPIDAVREIIKIGMVTAIPDSPDFIKGIVNVRGEIVTAIDVKLRFRLPDVRDAEAKHIVVTKQEDGLFGLIVDEVVEVLRIQKDDIKPPPSLVTRIHKKYINGVISHDSRLIILLDLTKILSENELIQYSTTKKPKLDRRLDNVPDVSNNKAIDPVAARTEKKSKRK